jgi:thiamine-phosphate pyrophosphorylase
MAPTLPRLYAIIDRACFGGEVAEIKDFARELILGGVTLIQYRNKTGDTCEMLEHARELKQLAGAMSSSPAVRLIMNDSADLCLAADFDGVHLGQDDLSPVGARAVLGPDKWVGFSTHTENQLREADQLPLDYIAIGPVFTTASKAKPDPLIGLDGIRRARGLTAKRLVAIGGITRENCRAAIDAGADCVAVIGDLLGKPGSAAKAFLRLLE